MGIALPVKTNCLSLFVEEKGMESCIELSGPSRRVPRRWGGLDGANGLFRLVVAVVGSSSLSSSSAASSSPSKSSSLSSFGAAFFSGGFKLNRPGNITRNLVGPFVLILDGNDNDVVGCVARLRKKTSDPLQFVWRRLPGVNVSSLFDVMIGLQDTGHPLGMCCCCGAAAFLEAAAEEEEDEAPVFFNDANDVGFLTVGLTLTADFALVVFDAAAALAILWIG